MRESYGSMSDAMRNAIDEAHLAEARALRERAMSKALDGRHMTTDEFVASGFRANDATLGLLGWKLKRHVLAAARGVANGQIETPTDKEKADG